jgi:hypothetical protein
MIYVIVYFNPMIDFAIRLSGKELSEMSYKKFDTLMSFDPDPQNKLYFVQKYKSTFEIISGGGKTLP